MSGGQQQRVALARALVNRPRALLLDEPLGALDLRLRKQLQIELSHIQREVGITFVHVTHDQEEAMSMADTIAVMRDGRIDQLGAAAELYDTPRTEFVANFLGSSNLLDARPTGREGTVATFEADGARGCTSRRARLRGGRATARCGSACGPRRSRCSRPTTRRTGGQRVERCCSARSRTRASSASRRSTSSARTAGRTSRSSRRTPASGLEQLGPGRRVAAIWDPDHTFVVSQGDSNAA